MANTFTSVRLYPHSKIGDILRIARERASQEEQRTKKYMSDQLGITVERITRMEAGTAQVPFEIAVDWCQLLGDYTALKHIKHCYGLALPPTDPWLLQSVPDQLNNFIHQAHGAIEAAQALLMLSHQRRRESFSENTEREILCLAEEILDVQQSFDCVIASLQMNWNMDTDTLFKNWIQEALTDQVIIPSISEFEKIRKQEFFEERERMAVRKR